MIYFVFVLDKERKNNKLNMLMGHNDLLDSVALEKW